MQYIVNDVLQIKGELYNVVGIIQYKNLNDNCTWLEYRLISQKNRKEIWLSFDTTYNEYSLSWAVGNTSTSEYHIVDSGTELVTGVWGSVDVEQGDQAFFKEYEDSTEQKIMSVEIWDDEEETSAGYYIEQNDIVLYDRNNMNGYTNTSGGSSVFSKIRPGKYGQKKRPVLSGVITVVFILIAVFSFLRSLDILPFGNSTSIQSYLDESTAYEYSTSITGNDGEKADVYKSSLTLDATVKDIINAIEGDTENVQQNTEDNDDSVALLTDDEYALVYTSEENEILVQISSRKYSYRNDNNLYHSRLRTRRFYRRFYYSRAYNNDSSSYGESGSSPYSNFDDSTINYSSSDTYNTYSSSVRQSSVNRRRSSGGGLSGGK